MFDGEFLIKVQIKIGMYIYNFTNKQFIMLLANEPEALLYNISICQYGILKI